MESSPPEPLSRSKNIDLTGRRWEVWLRRAGLLVFTAIAALALANVFGQRPSTSTATGGAATLEIEAPRALRGGLIYQARFRIVAIRPLRHPELVLAPGWFEGMTLNSVIPEPADVTEQNGRVVLSYDELPAGGVLGVRLQFQVNPTAVGTRSQEVALEDNGVPVARIARDVVVYP